MDFRREKLYLTLKITAFGLFIALIWHGWQGWVLGRQYPYNTFLFPPRLRFGDLSVPLRVAALPSPYSDKTSGYFPFAYWLLHYFTGIHPTIVAYAYLSATLAGLFAVLMYVLRPVIPGMIKRIGCSAGLLLFSYPVLFCLDRANIEITMVLLVSISLICFVKRRWISGLAWLFPTICLKLYPILLLALILRPKHLVKIALTVLAFFIVTVACMASFAYTIPDNYHMLQHNLNYFTKTYIIQSTGLAGSASPWNTCKVFLLAAYYIVHYIVKGGHVSIPANLVYFAYHIYSVAALASILIVVIYVTFVERVFLRRAILLLLLTAMITPSGGDYKLLFADLALMVLILLDKKRRHDLLVTGILAFVIIPKKEFFLPYTGLTDTYTQDVAIAVLINPPCMLSAMGLLIRDGFQSGTPSYMRNRFLRQLNWLRTLPKRRRIVDSSVHIG